MSLKSIFLIGLFTITTNAYALLSDRDQPIEIEADRVEVNEKKEISHYQGNVRMHQGTLKIMADEVFVYMQEGRLDKIIILGQPAEFEQQPENKQDIVKSRAEHMEYFANKELLILKRNANIVQGGNHFSGDFIEYDTLSSTVKANKEQNSDSRVHAVIQPKTEQDAPAEEPQQPPLTPETSTPP